jgi:hypothetical protein
MSDDQKAMFQAMMINVAGKSGILNGVAMPGMTSPAAKPGEPSTMDRLINAVNALKPPSK